MNITKELVISIDYTLTDQENKVLDSTIGSSPFMYLHGYNNIIPGLEQILEGKSVGDHFKTTILAKNAYGEWNQELVFNIPREQFEGVENIEPGMQFEIHTPEGVRELTVIEIDAETDAVVVDTNHPLAGIDLTFDVTVRDIRQPSSEELEHGHVHHEHDDCQDHA
jgi:FKBP-type peptidyl-prolyl cis-trans isomerase SlyD